MYSEKLIFYERPTVEFANNIFINVPTILQFDDIPIISIKKTLIRKHYIHTEIFHKDGTGLAVCDSLRLFLTEEGKKTNIKLIRPQDDMAVCTLDGKTILEIRRNGPFSVNIDAELYTPTGYLVKYSKEKAALNLFQGQMLIGSNAISDCTFEASDIGVWCRSNGSIDIGRNFDRIRQRA